jgi:capsular polysaccharide transport system permease protein
LTPPTAGKPKPNLSSDSNEAVSEEAPEITEATEAPKTGRGGVTKLHTGPARRRSAALDLRVAHSRAASAPGGADAGEASGGTEATGATGKTGRTGKTGGRSRGGGSGRLGGKGSRGGKAAQKAADGAEVAAEADPAETEATGAVAEPETAGQPEVVTEAPAEPVSEMPAAPEPAVEPDPQDGEDGGDGEAEAPAPGRGRRKVAATRRTSAAGKAAKPDMSDYVVAPTVSAATLRPRHYGVIALFVLMVVVPTVAYSWYLWNRAADQYESNIGFGSRTEEAPSTFDFLGALGGSSSTSSKDMDIVNQFIVSQDLVDRIDRKLDLRAMYSKPQNDPLGAFDPNGTIEDLVEFWQRMLVVNYDPGTGLMNLKIFAFDPEDARSIAWEVLNESTVLINNLSVASQNDATRYSKEALELAEERLSKARVALTSFRVANNIVDPSNSIASQLSVLNTLVQQMAAAQIDLDLLTGSAAENDPRIAQLKRRIEVIANRIAEEKAKVGAVSDSSSTGYAALVSDYQRLQVDNDFAEKAYLSALAAYDQSVTDAQRKSAYLATFVEPTLAQAPTAPNRPLSAALTALIGFLAWAITVLIYYALRDRR